MRGSKVIGLLAVAVGLSAVVAGFWLAGGRRGGAAPVSLPAAAPVITSQVVPPVTATPSTADPTTVDHMAKPGWERLFTEEQTRRIEETRRRFAELEPQRIEAEREMTLARARSMGSPDIAPKVAALREAREELDRFVRTTPERAEAEQHLIAMRRQEQETLARAELFQRHVNLHWREKQADPDECEWCRRDAARLLAADPSLAADYAREQRDLATAAMRSAAAVRDAMTAARAAALAARESDAGRALVERLAAAQRDLDAAVGGLPDVVRWREVGETVTAEQKALMEELRELTRQAPLVEAAVAGGSTGGGTVVP